MQNWQGKEWVKVTGKSVPTNEMTLLETLEAIWAMYILTLKNPKFLGVPYSNLGNGVYSRMRTLVSEMEFQRTRDARNV